MGAGFHGGFGHTAGSQSSDIPITSPSDMKYADSRDKINTYLLDMNHKDGGSKAKFLITVLGYSHDTAEILFHNIVNSIVGRTPTKTTVTSYGIKHSYDTRLVGINGTVKTARVVVVIQKDNGKVRYRLITAHPGKKED